MKTELKSKSFSKAFFKFISPPKAVRFSTAAVKIIGWVLTMIGWLVEAVKLLSDWKSSILYSFSGIKPEKKGE